MGGHWAERRSGHLKDSGVGAAYSKNDYADAARQVSAEEAPIPRKLSQHDRLQHQKTLL